MKTQQKREYTEEELKSIDEVDKLRKQIKKKKRVQGEALAVFRH